MCGFVGLELFQTSFAGLVHYGVIVRGTVVPRGQRYGPFRGKQVNTSEIKTNDDNTLMWEVSQSIDESINQLISQLTDELINNSSVKINKE